MNRIMKVTFVSIVAVAATVMAQADHKNLNGIDRLRAEVLDLNAKVQAAPLHPVVKSAMLTFAGEVEGAYACAVAGGDTGREPRDTQPGGNEPKDKDELVIGVLDHGDGSNCPKQMSKVEVSWYPVERFLYDTSFDLPEVYEHYIDTRESLYLLPNVRGGWRGKGYITCNLQSANGRSYAGIGYTDREARKQAERSCKAFESDRYCSGVAYCR